jgi:UDP-N-acetylglucosamine 2-epimerase (non-hydrolysing)
MKILTVVGARPNFMKAAAIIAAIRKHNRELERDGAGQAIDHILVHTGQHYDALMSDAFFADLSMPAPDVMLGVGSGSHLVQTAEILKKFEAVLLDERPDIVVVVGDVNSTVACALATAKIVFKETGGHPLLAHVESGLRSFDRSMPEEVNRVVTDHVSDLLFVTEESGVENLRAEGIPPQRIFFVGNTMIDSLLTFDKKAETSTVLERLGLRPSNRDCGDAVRYALLTLHRPSNVDCRETFLNILKGLQGLARECPIVFPVHPRTQKQIKNFGLEDWPSASGNNGQGRTGDTGLLLTEPLGYLDFLCIMKHAALVITDSGGIQEETTFLGVPCITVRDNTERPVTVSNGTNIIAGTNKESIQDAIRLQMAPRAQNGKARPPKWDGNAGTRVIEVLMQSFSETSTRRGTCSVVA